MKKIKKEVKKLTSVPEVINLPKTTIKNILSYLPKLKDYYLLKEEEDYLILGTVIEILEHKDFFGNLFQPRSEDKERKMSVFFIVTMNDILLSKIVIPNLEDINEIPVIRFNKNAKHSAEDIEFLCNRELRIEMEDR